MSAKGLLDRNNTIADREGMARYRDANRDVMTRYGARFIMMGGKKKVKEGPEDSVRPNITVVEFPSYDDAIACWEDPEYHAAAKLRHAASEGWLVVVEGDDGPQDFGGDAHRN